MGWILRGWRDILRARLASMSGAVLSVSNRQGPLSRISRQPLSSWDSKPVDIGGDYHAHFLNGRLARNRARSWHPLHVRRIVNSLPANEGLAKMTFRIYKNWTSIWAFRHL